MLLTAFLSHFGLPAAAGPLKHTQRDRRGPAGFRESLKIGLARLPNETVRQSGFQLSEKMVLSLFNVPPLEPVKHYVVFRVELGRIQRLDLLPSRPNRA